MHILGKLVLSNLHRILYCEGRINMCYASNVDQSNITDQKDIGVHIAGHFRKDYHRVIGHKPVLKGQMKETGVAIRSHTDPQGTGQV